MNERGNYQIGFDTHCLIRRDTPSEAAARTLIGDPGTNPTMAILAIGGTLAVISVIGTIGLVADIVAPRQKALPATTSQKVVRVGLLGGVVGAGAYAYFSGRR